jgi:hypothetical protein
MCHPCSILLVTSLASRLFIIPSRPRLAPPDQIVSEFVLNCQWNTAKPERVPKSQPHTYGEPKLYFVNIMPSKNAPANAIPFGLQTRAPLQSHLRARGRVMPQVEISIELLITRTLMTKRIHVMQSDPTSGPSRFVFGF